MNTRVTHRLVGYDRTTEAVAVQHVIPAQRFEFARRIASVPSDDPDAVFCYRLNAHQARDIARAIGAPIDADAAIFFMEGFADNGRAA